MLAISININIFLIGALLLVAFFAGYLLRGNELRKQRNKIYELEQEMLSNHAEILELEKQQAMLLKKLEKRDVKRET
jgi:hypothetical protein